jgi:hypothetical protein
MIHFMISHLGDEITSPETSTSRIEYCLETSMLSMLLNSNSKDGTFAAAMSKLMALDSESWDLFRIGRPTEMNQELQNQLLNSRDLDQTADQMVFHLAQVKQMMKAGPNKEVFESLDSMRRENLAEVSEDLIDQTLLAEFSFRCAS